MNILVIDDDPMVRICMRRWLPEHRLQFAETEHEALSKIRSDRSGIDLVLCDSLIPPHAPGEIAKKVVSDYPGLPLAVLSTNPSWGTPKERNDVRECVREHDAAYSQSLAQNVLLTRESIQNLASQITRESTADDHV